jgi:PST family polysaccharide transporter
VNRPSSRLREIAGSSVKVGVATLAGLFGWVVGGKLLALELGAAGVGVFGLLRQLLQNLSVFSTFSGSNALVQGLASRSGEPQARYAHSVARLYGIGGLIVAGVIGLGAPWLGPWLIPHQDSASLLRWLSLAVLTLTAQSYFAGLLNGHRAVDALVRSQILGPIAVLLLAYPVALLVRLGSPAGMVLLLIVPNGVVAMAAMLRARRSGWFRPLAYPGVVREDVASFLRMSAVLLVSGLLVTGTQYLQSRLVAEFLGLEQAGMFWVAWTLSMTYVTVLLGSYGTYYMPALSALTDQAQRHGLIRDYLRLALVVMPALVSLIILVKPWIVLLMFSPKLLPSLEVMRWMLIGDLFKGVAWVLAFPMLAFKEMRWFFWTELVFSTALAGTSAASLWMGGGIEILGVLFALAYAAYLLAMYVYIRTAHGFAVRGSELILFGWGLAIIGTMSWLTWSSTEVAPVAAIAYTILVPSFLLTVYWRRHWFFARAAT